MQSSQQILKASEYIRILHGVHGIEISRILNVVSEVQ